MATLASLHLDLSGLDGKWTRRMGNYPICAVCDKPVGAEEHDNNCAVLAAQDDEYGDTPCTCGAGDVPLLLFRGKGKNCLALAFHSACAQPRMRT